MKNALTFAYMSLMLVALLSCSKNDDATPAAAVPVNSLILNGGGVGTTDWIGVNDSIEGHPFIPYNFCPKYWDNIGGVQKDTILTGNGFEDRYLRCENTKNKPLNTNDVSYQISKNTIYKLTFKYRSSLPLSVGLRGHLSQTILIFPSTTNVFVENQGAPVLATLYFKHQLDFGVYLSFSCETGVPPYHGSVGDWLEIDEVNLIIR